MMKIRQPVTFVLSGILLLIAILFSLKSISIGFLIMILFGGSLLYVSLSRNRKAVIVFGHASIVAGCILVTWGIYLLPHSKPILAHILLRPLFWGFIAILGGICANYHGFCKCIQNK